MDFNELWWLIVFTAQEGKNKGRRKQLGLARSHFLVAFAHSLLAHTNRLTLTARPAALRPPVSNALRAPLDGALAKTSKGV